MTDKLSHRQLTDIIISRRSQKTQKLCVTKQKPQKIQYPKKPKKMTDGKNPEYVTTQSKNPEKILYPKKEKCD